MDGALQVVRLSIWGSVGRQLASRQGIRGVPTFVLFDGSGRAIQTQVGRLDPERIEEAVETLRR
jgi:thioredoxin-related protein